jgi:hypothetical protein
MMRKHQLVFAMTVLVGAGMMVAAQTPPQAPVDFSKAVTAEVRNDRGQIVLSGQFKAASSKPDEREQKAVLVQTGIDADASGEAEIETFGSNTKRHQEIEFEVRNLEPGGVFSFFIDNRLFATVTTDNRGKAQHERDVPMP